MLVVLMITNCIKIIILHPLWVCLPDGDGVSVMIKLVFGDCTLVDCSVTKVDNTGVMSLEDGVIDDDVIGDDVIGDDVIDDDDVTMLLVVLMEANVVVDNIALGVDKLMILAVLLFTGKLVDCNRDEVISIVLIVIVDSNSLVTLVTNIDEVVELGTLNCKLLKDNIPDPSSDVKIPMDDACNKSIDSVMIISDDTTEEVGETTSEQSEIFMLSIDNSSSLRFVVTLNIN